MEHYICKWNGREKLMDIQFKCGHCGHPLEATEEHAGREAKCPACGYPTIIPFARGTGVLGLRFVASFLDVVVASLILCLASSAVSLLSVLAPRWELVPIFCGLIACVIHVSVVPKKFGGTLGKIAVGLRIVPSNQQQFSYGRLALREFVKWILIAINPIVMIADKANRGLHDQATKSSVVKAQRRRTAPVLIGLFCTYLVILIGDKYLGNLHLCKARTCFDKARYTECIQHTEEARQLGQSDSMTCLLLSRAYRITGDHYKAVDAIQRVEDRTDAYYLEHGLLYEHEGKLEVAYDHFHDTLKKNPQNKEAQEALSRVANGLAQKYYMQASAYFDKYSSTGDWRELEGAVRNLELGLKYDAQNSEIKQKLVESRLILGEACLQEEDWQSALDHSQKVIELEKNRPEAHNILGVALLMDGKDEQALQELEALLDKGIDSSALRGCLGWAHYNLGDKEKAIKEYKKALEINPKDALALGDLAWIYEESENYKSALELYEEFADYNPTDPAVWNRIGVVRLALGDLDRACEAWSQSDVLKLEVVGAEQSPIERIATRVYTNNIEEVRQKLDSGERIIGHWYAEYVEKPTALLWRIFHRVVICTDRKVILLKWTSEFDLLSPVGAFLSSALAATEGDVLSLLMLGSDATSQDEKALREKVDPQQVQMKLVSYQNIAAVKLLEADRVSLQSQFFDTLAVTKLQVSMKDGDYFWDAPSQHMLVGARASDRLWSVMEYYVHDRDPQR
jgi:tetratricopeptide (TPR) repeat protein/uncharacterized RDD family membrane protein YckC/DNA-directed RNA polymerase subunit RPC12/RpoP